MNLKKKKEKVLLSVDGVSVSLASGLRSIFFGLFRNLRKTLSLVPETSAGVLQEINTGDSS